MARFIKLSNGVLFDVEQLQAVVRQDINKYVLVINQCPINPILDSGEVKALEAILGVEELGTVEDETKVALA